MTPIFWISTSSSLNKFKLSVTMRVANFPAVSAFAFPTREPVRWAKTISRHTYKECRDKSSSSGSHDDHRSQASSLKWRGCHVRRLPALGRLSRRNISTRLVSKSSRGFTEPHKFTEDLGAFDSTDGAVEPVFVEHVDDQWCCTRQETVGSPYA